MGLAKRHRKLACLRRGSVALLLALAAGTVAAQSTARPVLHGKHWVAITGKPLAATAGATVFSRGGNAVDAACAMLAATTTMWDMLSWGGETVALIYSPHTGQIRSINALGMAPTGATPEFFQARGMRYPPDFGPLAATTPGTPGGLMVMLAEFGTMSLAEVLAPAMQMAEGYPVEESQAVSIEHYKEILRRWPASSAVFLPHNDAADPQRWSAPYPGELLRQPDLLRTLQRLVDAERQALANGKSREEAILAAYERFYRGDIAAELVAAVEAAGGLITLQDLDRWEVRIEDPVVTSYRGTEVYKPGHFVQGPVMLQTLNILENLDLRAMGYNSTRYVHTLYQAMSLAFADRDFYYGDPYLPPLEPIIGLLSKDYARLRFQQINWNRNDPAVQPGDPYAFQNEANPYRELLEEWQPVLPGSAERDEGPKQARVLSDDEAFAAGTTSIQAADAEGWVVSVTPSGGWIPAFIAGSTGIGLSQRMQSFVLDASTNPFNVLIPGKRPRATLTPSIALRDGRPYLSFAAQGGDSQDQNLLQFFLNVTEFGMGVQQAAEAANINSYQMHSSFGEHASEPGRLLVREDLPAWTRAELGRMGYRIETEPKTSGPITAIFFDQDNDSMWGAASDFDEDYGIAW